MVYGLALERNAYERDYQVKRDIVSEVSRSPAGNVLLRVSRELEAGAGTGFGQIAHVVLTPQEADGLAGEIRVHRQDEQAFNRALEVFEREFARVYRDVVWRPGSPVDKDQARHEAMQEALEFALAVYNGAKRYIVEAWDEDDEFVEAISVTAFDREDAVERAWPRIKLLRQEREDENIMAARVYTDGEGA